MSLHVSKSDTTRCLFQSRLLAQPKIGRGSALLLLERERERERDMADALIGISERDGERLRHSLRGYQIQHVYLREILVTH